MHNYEKKSTEGWSIGNILLDFSGRENDSSINHPGSQTQCVVVVVASQERGEIYLHVDGKGGVLRKFILNDYVKGTVQQDGRGILLCIIQKLCSIANDVAP